jgi:serine/threonine protein kinase
MIIDDPVPTLQSNQCRYMPSNWFQGFIDSCLHKNPMFRMGVHHALQHPFLRKAPSPVLLQKYLSKRPELDQRVSAKITEEEEDVDADWDELNFLETTWNFGVNTQLVIDLATDTPITPDDDVLFQLPKYSQLTLTRLPEEEI